MTQVGERYELITNTNNINRIFYILYCIIQIKRMIDHDPRYGAIESPDIREDLFRNYCRKLEVEGEEEIARREDERRQRDRKARYGVAVFHYSFYVEH